MNLIKITWADLGSALISEWVVGHNPAAVAEKLAQVVVPADDYFIWLTGEGAAVKSLLARFEGEEIDPQLERSRTLAQQVRAEKTRLRLAPYPGYWARRRGEPSPGKAR